MKNVNIYGVEMTSLENMQFSEYIMREGIGMNALTAEKRTELAQKWLDSKKESIIDIQAIVMEVLQENEVYRRVDEVCYKTVSIEVEKRIKEKLDKGFKFL